MRMGEAKPRTDGPGGEFDVVKSKTAAESDAAGSITGNTATFPVVTGRRCAASEQAPMAATALL